MVEDEAGLGVPDAELLRRGDKVRILQHQPKDFTTEARFSEKDFEVMYPPLMHQTAIRLINRLVFYQGKNRSKTGPKEVS